MRKLRKCKQRRILATRHKELRTFLRTRKGKVALGIWDAIHTYAKEYGMMRDLLQQGMHTTSTNTSFLESRSTIDD